MTQLTPTNPGRPLFLGHRNVTAAQNELRFLLHLYRRWTTTQCQPLHLPGHTYQALRRNINRRSLSLPSLKRRSHHTGTTTIRATRTTASGSSSLHSARQGHCRQCKWLNRSLSPSLSLSRNPLDMHSVSGAYHSATCPSSHAATASICAAISAPQFPQAGLPPALMQQMPAAALGQAPDGTERVKKFHCEIIETKP